MAQTLHNCNFNSVKAFDERFRTGAQDPFYERTLTFHIQGSFDDIIYQDLAMWLVYHIDSFRTYFHLGPTKKLHAIEDSNAQYEVSVRDVGIMADADQTVSSQCRPIDLLNGPIVVFNILRCRLKHYSRLVLTCSHFATDFITYQLINQSIKQYFGGQMKLKTRTTTYIEWMDSYFQYSSDARGAAEAEFWHKMSSDVFSSARNLFREFIVEPRRMSFSLGRPLVTAIFRLCETNQARILHVVTTCVVDAIAEVTAMESVPINWSTHGRCPLDGLDFTSTSGWLSNRHPFIMPKSRFDILKCAAMFRTQLMHLPVLGCAYSWLTRYCPGGCGLEAALHSPFTFNIWQSQRAWRCEDNGSDSSTFISFPNITSSPMSLEDCKRNMMEGNRLYPMYFVINLNIDITVSLMDSGGGPPGIGERIMERTLAILYDAVKPFV